jgi:hypothetical protein
MPNRTICAVCVGCFLLCGFLRAALAADPASPDFVYVCRDAGAGGYQAFPDVCRLQDGRLMAVFYAGYGHIAMPCPSLPKGGRVAFCTSSDEGHTWSKAETLVDTADDDRDPSIVQLKNGTLICDFFRLHRKSDPSQPVSNQFTEPYDGMGSWIVTSNDLGKTWSEPRAISSKDWYCSAPIRELSDGRLILGLYREKPSMGGVTLSDDGGKTWCDPIGIDNAGHQLDAETDVIELADGRLWAAERSSGTPACWAVSSDRGKTWTKSEPLDFIAHCAYLLRTRDNIILFGYRGYDDVKAPSGGGHTYLRYSLDECKSWSGPVMVDQCIGAYPSMVNLKDGSVLIVYYEEGSNSSIRAKRFRATASGIEWLAP